MIWAIRLLWAEAAGLGAVTVFLVYEVLTATGTDLVSALFVTVFAAAGAAALAFLGRAARPAAGRRPRAGDRAPADAGAGGLLHDQAGLGWLGIPLIALGLLVCGLMLTPASTNALVHRQ